MGLSMNLAYRGSVLVLWHHRLVCLSVEWFAFCSFVLRETGHSSLITVDVLWSVCELQKVPMDKQGVCMSELVC